MNYASTRIQTTEGGKYILKLCRHFAHKVPAEFTALHGQVRFPQGQCVMEADALSLAICLRAGAQDGIGAMQSIIDDHLQRFVRFETLSYRWDAGVPETAKPALAALALPGSIP